MTDRYVGIGGNDGSNGLSWANRKLTLNGAEDTPVVAGDTVYVGPGAYREQLATDVDGTSGAGVITYIGDVTGENTDGIGGIVRIAGSDNDQTATRANSITINGEDYRTFRGFYLDTTTSYVVQINNGVGNILEDCFIAYGGGNQTVMIGTSAGTGSTTIRRCIILPSAQASIQIASASSGHLIENSIIIGHGESNGRCIRINVDAAGAIKNCTLVAGKYGVSATTTLTGSFTLNNTIIANMDKAIDADATGDIVEDYNTLWNNATDRVNTSVGGNTVSYPPLFESPLLKAGILMPWMFGALSEWSQIARIAGTSEATDDLFGITRPATSSKKSWGAIQLREGERDTATKRTGTASLKLADAGDHQMFLPVDGTEITISCYTLFETNYAGTKPQMIIRQPGQSDDVTLATGAVDTQEQLTTTLTPSATPGYVVVIMRSNNTATSGSYATYFDDLAVS